MKAFFRGKNWIVFGALIALFILVILAAGLSEVKFDQPFFAQLENIYSSDSAIKENIPAASWFRYLLIGMIVVLFLLFLGPIRPQTSRDLLKQLLRFALFTFIAMIFLGRFAQANPFLFGNVQSTSSAPGSNGGLQPFSPPDVSAGGEFWITTLIVIVIGALVILVFNRLIDKWFQPKPMDEIANIARSTLRDLSHDKPSKNAIIRCYTRMNSAVNEWRGISRNASMTPAEFAKALESAGLPGEDVQSLTRVFERVRYGAQVVSAEEIKEAKQCLTGILKACEIKP
jgi:hypothetical protein